MLSPTVRGVVVLTMVVCAIPALALDPSLALTQYVQTAWRMQDGLPHNTVRSVIQSRDGYLWLGTYGGLVRFDGSRFVVFDNRNSRLLHNAITSLVEDREGTIWIGTTAGGLHRFREGTVEPFRGIAHRSINALAAAPDGTVWVGTTEGLYAIRSGIATKVGEREGFTTSINAMVRSRDGLWLGTNKGLYRVHAGRVRRFDNLGDGDVMSVFVDGRGHLWAGRVDRVFELAWDAGSSSLRQIRDMTLPGVWGWINAFIEDRDGNLWIGTYGAGLFRWSGGKLESISTDRGLIDHRPWALLEDAEGGIWLGTRGGLARLRDGAATSFSTEEGLPNPIVRTLREDVDGTIWIATEAGVARLRDGKLDALDGLDGFRNSAVRGIGRDRDGNFWIGGDGGLALIDPVQGRTLRLIRNATPDGRLRNLYFDRAGRTWIGTARGVFFTEESPVHGRWKTPPGLEDLASASIESFYEDRDGAVWVGTLYDGMRRWKAGAVENPVLLEATAVGVRTFHEDPDGTFYAGTLSSGLFVRLPGKPFVRITTREGLPEDGIWSILPVGDIYWMATDRGIFGVRRESLLDVVRGRTRKVVIDRLVGVQDGMKSAECNGGGTPSGIISRDGRVWVPTSRGAVALDPRKLSRNRRPPPVIVEETVIDGRVIRNSKAIEVPAGSRDVEIHFTGLSFGDPSRVRFRYQLAGHDEGWHDTGTRRAAYFSRLPPGTYILQVQAANNDGFWNVDGAKLQVRVLPRLYETWWFRVLTALALALMIRTWLYLRTRSHRQREAELRRIVEERTEELQRANELLARLAEIDDLTGIANHRRFLAVLDDEWHRCERNGDPLSLLLCDIDDFKAYNDTYGHLEGDDCLRRVAAAMTAALARRTDLAARYGGEEFAIILPSTDADGAHEVALRVLEAVRSVHIAHRASRAAAIVTLSIGCATVQPQPGTDPNDLVGAADAALYTAKAAGRNRVVSAVDDPAMEMGLG